MNNYAAPHTPIASSKRPRQPTSSSKKSSINLDIKSPVKMMKLLPKTESAVTPIITKTPENEHITETSASSGEQPTSFSSSSSPKFVLPALHEGDSAVVVGSVQSLLFSPFLKKDEAAADTGRSSARSASTISEDQDVEFDEGDGEEEEFNPYVFMAQLPPHSSVVDSAKICLPGQCSDSSKHTLVLDLDETLVHCTVEPVEKADLTFPVTFNGTCYQVYVRKRPYLDYFLEAVSATFEVVVFTASQKVYADALLDRLDPQKNWFHHRLFREACLFVHGNYLKDLTVLGRDLSTVLLVDNSPHAYSYQVDNGVPIESWFDDDNDTELLKLASFLKHAQLVSDVRPLIRNHFKTYKLIQRAQRSMC